MFSKDKPTRDINFQKIHQRIEHIVDNYENQIIKHINSEYQTQTKWSDRLADKIAAFGGSWGFILSFAIFLIVWMTWNMLSFTTHFDEPPFILLNLILSFIASFQAPIILMSQNRQSARDKHEAVIDFAINYKAEQEIDNMHRDLHEIEKKIEEIRNILEKSKKDE